ncbi:acetyl-CoA carboxylase carboxyl transferase subunit alpha/beta, partial [Desulfobulbus sp. F3]|nr:acetyl-CoA carboxylase carboxyl transferase subunit alpha/beta [Desulfobulbus sp. F3]
MNDLIKQLQELDQRIGYLIHIKDSDSWGNVAEFRRKSEQLRTAVFDISRDEFATRLGKLEDSIRFLEERCEEGLTPMERVRIV